MELEKPYPVFDESGKVQSWLDSGRGLRVWQSHDIGAGRPDMLTPGDATEKPHWAYPEPSEILTAADVVFFHKVMVDRSWTDTPAGWRAAQRYLGSMSIAEKHEDVQVPIGRKLTRYTIEGLRLDSETKVHMPGTPAHGPIPGTEAYDRPLHVEYRVAVVRWVCIIPSDIPYSERKAQQA